MFRPQTTAYIRSIHVREPEYRARSRSTVIDAILIVAGFVALGYALYSAQFSSGVRWGLGILAIVATGLVAWWAVNRRTHVLEAYESPGGAAHSQSGELWLLTQTVRRATQGLPFSQALVADRVRDSFTEYARLALGLSPDAMRRMTADPVALRRTFRDPDLADFLLVPSSDQEDGRPAFAESSGGRAFDASIRSVLDRMEAWR